MSPPVCVVASNLNDVFQFKERFFQEDNSKNFVKVDETERILGEIKEILPYDSVFDCVSRDDSNLLNIKDLERKLNIKSRNHMDIKYEIPERLKIDPEKQPVRKLNNLFPKENRKSKVDLNNIIGIISSPNPTNSTELKKETYLRG